MRNMFAFIPSIPTAPPKRSLRSRMEKERHNKSLGEEYNTLSDLRDHLRNFIFCFTKLYKNL